MPEAGSRDAASSSAARPPDLWYTRCPVPTASSIAIDRGLLDDEFAADGLSVASLRASAELGVREAHFDHSQANLFRQGGNIPPIWSRSQGKDTAVVAISWVDEYQAIVALPDSGIADAKGLKGRRLGLPRRVNDPIDYWRAMCLRGYLSALATAGLGEGDVELVDLPVEEKQIATGGTSATGTLWSGGPRARRQQREAFALIRGECDAIYTASAPGAQLTAFLGARIVVDLGNHPTPAMRVNNQTPTILTVSGELVRERPEIVARYLRVLLRAAGWAESHPAETLRTIANDVGATEEWVTAAYGADIHRRLALDLDSASVGALEAQKKFLLRHGFIARDFDLQAWIDPRPLALATRWS